MGENSKIAWTDHSFNGWIGCGEVSPGCLNCYAKRQDKTWKWTPDGWGRGKPRKLTKPSNWEIPKKWNRKAEKSGKRLKVFCASLSDWLDGEVPIEWRVRLLELIFSTPHLDWLLLSKRPQNFFPFLNDAKDYARENGYDAVYKELFFWLGSNTVAGTAFRPPSNVWIGTTAEDQVRWNERLPILMRIPAVVRFVSGEPLLGPINMAPWFPDWLIVGGESGDGHRPIKKEWVYSLLDQCRENKTPFFFKQWGGRTPDTNGRLLDGVEYLEFPKAQLSREPQLI